MSRLTVDEIFESYVNRYGQDRVHRQARTPFRGQPGHHYFVGRRVSNEHLAQISDRSRHAEAALVQMNDAYIVSIGNVGIANAPIAIPPRAARRQGLEEFRWIAHTHPLEQENRYQSVARGATGADYDALEEIYRRGWGEEQSEVIICRGGRIIEVKPFWREPPSTQQGVQDTLRSFTIDP
jgi:hypothetical protein